jgi:hypothetical protein
MAEEQFGAYLRGIRMIVKGAVTVNRSEPDEPTDIYELDDSPYTVIDYAEMDAVSAYPLDFARETSLDSKIRTLMLQARPDLQCTPFQSLVTEITP